MKYLSDNHGSALGATIITLLVMMILIGGFYMLAGSHYESSIDNESERQAYLYAKSECSTIANYFVTYQETKDSNDKYRNPFFIENVNGKKELGDENNAIKIQNADHTKEVKNLKSSYGSVERIKDDEFLITFNATVGRETATVKLTCEKVNGKWTIGNYE